MPRLTRRRAGRARGPEAQPRNANAAALHPVPSVSATDASFEAATPPAQADARYQALVQASGQIIWTARGDGTA